MHPYHVLPHLLSRLHSREEGLTMSEVMWSLAVVAMIGGIAYLLGPAIGADWTEFVGDPTR
jgi:hypothetical protein